MAKYKRKSLKLCTLVMKYRLTLVVAGSLILAGCQEPAAEFDFWDTNGDGYISTEEFASKWNGMDYYADWDENDDNLLDRQEWQTRLDEYYYDWDNDQLSAFNDWDQDGNDILTPAELGRGTFSYWDENQDGKVSAEEYDERAGDQQ